MAVTEMRKTSSAVWGVGEHKKLGFGRVKFEIPVETFIRLPSLTLFTVLLPLPPYNISSSGCIMFILVVLIHMT